MPPGAGFLDTVTYLSTLPIWELLIYFFNYGGWIIIFAMTYFGLFELHRHLRVHRFLHRFKFIYLAIDVPKLNEQTPRAVENIFAHLAGAHGTRDLVEKFWDGEIQRWFSFEIVSIEGYVQYIIMTEQKHKDLVESLIYAQYPDAEITQVEDYAAWAPTKYPNPEYKAWGVEWKLAEKEITPIRTWDDFEDKVTGDYKDPMSAILETLAKVGPGEQAWFQIIIRPIGQKWVKEGFHRVAELEGRLEHHQPLLLRLISWPLNQLHTIYQYALSGELENEEDKRKEERGQLFLRKTELAEIESIAKKVERIGFHCKIRFVYIARLENFNKNKVQHGMFGAMKQYSDDSGNALKPDTKHSQTTAHYFLIEKRKDLKRGHIVANYKARDVWRGTPRFILNARELASLWHFPLPGVKVPTLKLSETKTSRPPIELPTQHMHDLEFEGPEGTRPTPPIPRPSFLGGGLPVTNAPIQYGEATLSGRFLSKKKSAEEMANDEAGASGAPRPKILAPQAPQNASHSKRGGPPPNLPFA